MKLKYIVLLLLLIIFVGCDSNQSNKNNEKKAIETVVVFKDKGLENLIREELNVGEEEITSTHMLELKTIRTNNASVYDLTGLEYATNLYDISIFRQKIKSLNPISKLKSLKRITISYSSIEELPIKFDKEVQLLDLTIIDTLIKDVSFVKEMVTLENLTVTSCGINNINALSKLVNLTELSIDDNKIESIKSLTGKNKLQYLDLQDNNVSDISPLENLTALSELTLSYNPVTNLKPLESLKNLKLLTIYQHHDVKHLIYDQVDKLSDSGVEVLHHR